MDASDETGLVARYESGATVYELASSFGINRETVAVILGRHGIDRRYHECREVDLNRAAELHAGGLNLTEIADYLGIGRTTLIRARRAARLL